MAMRNMIGVPTNSGPFNTASCQINRIHTFIILDAYHLYKPLLPSLTHSITQWLTHSLGGNSLTLPCLRMSCHWDIIGYYASVGPSDLEALYLYYDLYLLQEVLRPYEPSCPLVGWLDVWLVVGWSVCHNFHKREGRHTSMLLSEHLFMFYVVYYLT